MSKSNHVMQRTGRMFRDARQRLGLSGCKLAARGFVNSSFIYQCESGQVYPGTVESLLRYAALYELDPVELFNAIREDLEYDRQHEGPAGKTRKLIEDAPGEMSAVRKG